MRRLSRLAPAALALLTAVAVFPVVGMAQVAAPSLIPATPGVVDPTLTKDPTIVPTNPALLGWPTPTRIAFGVIRADREQERVQFKSSSGAVLDEAAPTSIRYEGSYAGGVYHAGRYGIAAETLSIRDVTTAGAPLDDFRHKVAFGINLGSALTIGAGGHFDSDRQDNSHQRTTGYAAGASFRFADRFYVGGGTGVDDSKRCAVNTQGSNSSGTQTISVLGLGYLNDGPFRLHIEAWGGTISDNGSGGRSQTAQVQSAGIETRYGPLVAGFAMLLANGSFTSDDTKFDLNWGASEITLGVIADHGFGILYHYGFGTAATKGKFDNPYVGTISADINTASKAQSMTLVWQY